MKKKSYFDNRSISFIRIKLFIILSTFIFSINNLHAEGDHFQNTPTWERASISVKPFSFSIKVKTEGGRFILRPDKKSMYLACTHYSVLANIFGGIDGEGDRSGFYRKVVSLDMEYEWKYDHKTDIGELIVKNNSHTNLTSGSKKKECFLEGVQISLVDTQSTTFQDWDSFLGLKKGKPFILGEIDVYASVFGNNSLEVDSHFFNRHFSDRLPIHKRNVSSYKYEDVDLTAVKSVVFVDDVYYGYHESVDPANYFEYQPSPDDSFSLREFINKNENVILSYIYEPTTRLDGRIILGGPLEPSKEAVNTYKRMKAKHEAERKEFWRNYEKIKIATLNSSFLYLYIKEEKSGSIYRGEVDLYLKGDCKNGLYKGMLQSFWREASSPKGPLQKIEVEGVCTDQHIQFNAELLVVNDRGYGTLSGEPTQVDERVYPAQVRITKDEKWGVLGEVKLMEKDQDSKYEVTLLREFHPNTWLVKQIISNF